MTKIKTLYKTDWLSLNVLEDPRPDVDGYVYSHETRCQGIIVAVLPTRLVSSGGQVAIEYLLRNEKTPCWDADKLTMSAITGGYDGGSIVSNVVRELVEETGYLMDPADMIFLGTSRASKSTDTVYYLYTVDLTGIDVGKPTGDGSPQETEATNHWVGIVDITQCVDPQVAIMYVREAYLRLAHLGGLPRPNWITIDEDN